MSKNRKFVRVFQNLFQQFSRKSPSTVKEQSLWLLRSFIVTKKRPEWINAGFVLPTVAMVSLVVVLLTIAILFRSFERSKNASNVRVNQAVLNAATPAIDRAKAKIDRLFRDPRLPRSTPNDFSLKQVISNNISEFTFGDETQLTLSYNVDKLKTAWKYPVDTDNNGKYDSYTLYGIYFANPPTSGGKPTRVRSPLDARTPPMNEVRGSDRCERGDDTSAQLVGSQGWYKRDSTLKRSLFVYTATVPITDNIGIPNKSQNKYEIFKGNKGFAALEYQQDRERRPLTNNAVLYNDDLEIAPGGGIRLNGRIATNSNLLTGKTSNPIKFYLVSSPASCYFNERNSKIVVGGNVANARIRDSGNQSPIQVDLFRQIDVGQKPTEKNLQGANKGGVSVKKKGGQEIAYNGKAYEMRIQLLVDAAMAIKESDLPSEITEDIDKKIKADSSLNKTTLKEELLKTYFRKRTRRVPYGEIKFEDTDHKTKGALGSYKKSNVLKGNGDSLRPPEKWVFPFKPSDGKTYTGYANLELNTDGKKVHFSAQETDVPEPEGEEKYLGDRVLVGNNMPQMWWDEKRNKFVSQEEAGQEIKGKEWNKDDGKGGTSGKTRKRYPQVRQLDDLGATNRNEFWEQSAAEYPKEALDIVGGLRVVTGAGIYLPQGYTTSTSSSKFNTARLKTDKVWSDQMPVVSTLDKVQPQDVLPYPETPYLQMRATAVYHFQNDTYKPGTANPQKPVACVSSYYDPTNQTTAKNGKYRGKNLPWEYDKDGRSNNGIVYKPPTRGKSSYKSVLDYQAKLKYPNGRLVNEELKKALDKGSKELTLSEKSALDSAICALQIMDGSLTPIKPTSSDLPHGAIYERAFLDARQVKEIDKPGIPGSVTETQYGLDVELRQPLEIRTTVLDLEKLRTTSIGSTKNKTTEYYLPNSGIIYATRDDALPDLSDKTVDISATDFKLDPTRRPNGIMLVNGQQLNRSNKNLNKAEEKGLTLVSNLPVYIKGDFNKHTEEEFTNILESDWKDFYDRGDKDKKKKNNTNFACRPGQFAGCTTGETWRSATVIADAITVLSNNFELGYRQDGDYDLRENAGDRDYANNRIPLGYDYDGLNGVENKTVSLSEKILQFDINGDGDSKDLVSIAEKDITGTIAARLNGFWENNFVTSLPWYEKNPGEATDLNDNEIKSSYFNNFVTPIQRRVTFPEYLMEICRKPSVTACKPEDWVVGYNANGDANLDDAEKNIKAYQIQPDDPNYTLDKLGAGSTARPALLEEDQRFPRRIAFLRDANDKLVFPDDDPKKGPIPLGIKGSDITTIPSSLSIRKTELKKKDSEGKVYYYPYAKYGKYDSYSKSNRPRLRIQALWFKTKEGNSGNFGYEYPLWIENSRSDEKIYVEGTNQPLLAPVLQIHFPFRAPSKDISIDKKADAEKFWEKDDDITKKTNNWLQFPTDRTKTKAETVETNVVFVQGDTPGRPLESNGGLENFLRYLEAWTYRNKSNTEIKTIHKASGSFIQYRRSSYATAPWQAFTKGFGDYLRGYSSKAGTTFGYPQGYRTTTNRSSGKNMGRSPFYAQPDRSWGFDVALLTQQPDLFSQRFTAPPTGDPNEYYKEVSRDDKWVSTLLCAKDTDNKYVISKDQRPPQCQK